MQFNLKNMVKNLLNIYDSIEIGEKNLSENKIHYKKLKILLKKFKNYLEQDAVSALKYLKLIQIEYFLITNFSDIHQEEYDIESLLYMYDDFPNNLTDTYDYLFNMEYLKIMLDEIIRNYRDIRYYDYSLLLAALSEKDTAFIINELHPDIKSEESNLQVQKNLNRLLNSFFNNDNMTQMEFFLDLKHFYKMYQSKKIVKELATEKLIKLEKSNNECYEKILKILIKFYYYYGSNYQFSYQLLAENTENQERLDANDLLHHIAYSKDMAYLINEIGIDYYLDILLDSIFIYDVDSYNALKPSLTEEQQKVLKKLSN